jgi:hypothetical protein
MLLQHTLPLTLRCTSKVVIDFKTKDPFDFALNHLSMEKDLTFLKINHLYGMATKGKMDEESGARAYYIFLWA